MLQILCYQFFRTNCTYHSGQGGQDLGLLQDGADDCQMIKRILTNCIGLETQNLDFNTWIRATRKRFISCRFNRNLKRSQCNGKFCFNGFTRWLWYSKGHAREGLCSPFELAILHTGLGAAAALNIEILVTYSYVSFSVWRSWIWRENLRRCFDFYNGWTWVRNGV